MKKRHLLEQIQSITKYIENVEDMCGNLSTSRADVSWVRNLEERLEKLEKNPKGARMIHQDLIN